MRPTTIALVVLAYALIAIDAYLWYLAIIVHPGIGFTPWNTLAVYTTFFTIAIAIMAVVWLETDLQSELGNEGVSHVGHEEKQNSND